MTKKETKELSRLIDYFERMIPYYNEARNNESYNEELRTRAKWFYVELNYIWDEYIPKEWKEVETLHKWQEIFG